MVGGWPGFGQADRNNVWEGRQGQTQKLAGLAKLRRGLLYV